MKKNKINGVRPFNDFFFKSCYYHQLLAAVSSMGIDKDVVLLNAFSNIEEQFQVKKTGVFKEKKLEKLLGYKRKASNLNKRMLIRCIDKKSSIIVGVDCYFLESRIDSYYMEHTPHFILVYGYDLTSLKLNVIDHDYINSYSYMEKEISMDNLLYANKMYKAGLCKNKYTCYVISPKRSKNEFNIWKFIDKTKIESNRINSRKNLTELKKILTDGENVIKKNIERITFYLNDLKSFYFTFSRTKPFEINIDEQLNIMALTSAYSNILSLFWKLKIQGKYEYVTKKIKNIMSKIDEIEQREEKLYNYLMEVHKASGKI